MTNVITDVKPKQEENTKETTSVPKPKMYVSVVFMMEDGHFGYKPFNDFAIDMTTHDIMPLTDVAFLNIINQIDKHVMADNIATEVILRLQEIGARANIAQSPGTRKN